PFCPKSTATTRVQIERSVTSGRSASVAGVVRDVPGVEGPDVAPPPALVSSPQGLVQEAQGLTPVLVVGTGHDQAHDAQAGGLEGAAVPAREGHELGDRLLPIGV